MVIPGPVTRNLFFTGKGGVGKTSVASATAVGLADSGKRVLLVSTDPASNLDEVFQVELGIAPTPVPGVANLFAMNIDPEAAARAYRERMVGPYRGILPDASVRSMEEQFSGACTHGNRGVRRVLEAPGRCLGHRRVRPRYLRHRSDRPHLAAPATPRGLDCVLRHERGGKLLPGAALGPRRSASPLRSGVEGLGRRRDHNARARQSARDDLPSRGRPLEPRAFGAGHQESAARLKRHLCRERFERRNGRRDGGPRPGGVGRAAGRPGSSPAS